MSGGEWAILVAHAKRELDLSGQTEESPALSAAIVAAVEGFATYDGHSGGSHFVAVEMLATLLHFGALSPLTSDPEGWQDRSEMSGYPMWQSIRDSKMMSDDGGKTYWSVDSPDERHDSQPPT